MNRRLVSPLSPWRSLRTTLDLSPDREQLIRDLVAGGRFPSEGDVIEAAFRLLADRHRPRRVTPAMTAFDVLDQAGPIGCRDG